MPRCMRNVDVCEVVMSFRKTPNTECSDEVSRDFYSAQLESKYSNRRVEDAEKALLDYAARLARMYAAENSDKSRASAKALRRYCREIRLGMHR
jgi:hypothetical protein